MSVYTATLKTLSPLHIGDGYELRQGFDFVVHQGQTYRIDEDQIFIEKAQTLRPRLDGRYPTPGELLTDADYNNPRLFRYILRGFPRSRKTDARVRSFIKDVYDFPYIPGSSLKGALRTALAWSGWREVRIELDRNQIGRSKFWAAQPVERRIFGPNPNHDLLRALHVSDLAGAQKPAAGLILVNAQVLTHKNAGSPIELEAIAGDTTFSGSLTIDDTLFSNFAEQELHFGNRKHWLDEIMGRVQAHNKARILRLVEWYEKTPTAEAVARFYRQLAAVTPQPNQALLQIGWGVGWDGKTFWTHLQQNAQLFEQLVRDFRMHKSAPGSPPRIPGDEFPRSKRTAMVVKAGIPKAIAPFGWMLLEIVKQR